MVEIYHMDNLEYLIQETRKFSLMYIDPPYNTGKPQRRGEFSYKDDFGEIHIGRFEGFSIIGNYLDFLYSRIVIARDRLEDYGSFFIHIDWRVVHYVKVIMDYIFGKDNFMNEIIWAYDYGGRPKRYWPRKHDNILWYVKSKKNYIFNYEEMDRIPYMAPGLVGEEKASRGKTPTDVWWHTIVPTMSKEKTGYPTQKPLGILERIVKVHSNPGDLLLDFFSGSGSFGEAALKNNRNVVLVDNNKQAVEIMKDRLSKYMEE